MLTVLQNWFQKYFSDPEAVLLAVFLIVGFTLIVTMGGILAPVIASIILAYLLQWVVNSLLSWSVPRLVAVVIVYLGFLGLFFGVLLGLWPLIWQQLIHMFQELPSMLSRTQELLYLLPEKFPEYVSKEGVDSFTTGVIQQARELGTNMLSRTFSSLPGIFSLIIYLILVPMMVFFFLKDSKLITKWFSKFLPSKHVVLVQVLKEFDNQIGNYVRGKVVEVLIVGGVTYIVFALFEIQYAVLLAFMVGLSVFVPYVGAIAVTIPVVLIAFFQWGISPIFAWLVISYMIIQILDGNVVVPLLFSEAVNLHPIAIIVAILVFGSFWGFWGAFFAIPLATLVKAVLYSWPKGEFSKED